MEPRQPGRPRNRNAEVKAKGKRQVGFEISADLDDLIEQVRAALATQYGACSRTMALEAMGRAGAAVILGDGAK